MGVAFALINSIGASSLLHFRIRTLLLRSAGADVALRSRVFEHVIIRTRKLHVGTRSTINSGTIIDNRAHVWIGDRVGIAVGVRILTADHDYSDPLVRAGVGRAASVTIEDGAWIGSGATILPGITVGRGCVVAAGAVVTKDLAPHGLYTGVPARRLRDLPTATKPAVL
jgi:maltose O-acetyltransferase